MKSLVLKLALSCLFSFVVVSTVNCNILSGNIRPHIQDQDGVGKEMVYVVLNIGRIVGNMVFTIDDDLVISAPGHVMSGPEEKPTFWKNPGVSTIFFGVIVLFFLMFFMLFKGKIANLFGIKSKVQSP